jgi:hypothetical protein
MAKPLHDQVIVRALAIMETLCCENTSPIAAFRRNIVRIRTDTLAHRPRRRSAVEQLEGHGNQISSWNQNLSWPFSNRIVPLMRERASPDTSDAL